MTTLFIISLLGMVGIIGSKVLEVKFRKEHFVAKTIVKLDERVKHLIDVIVFKYHNYKKIARLFFFSFLPAIALELIIKLKNFLMQKYLKYSDEWRGRKVLRSDGSVSYFLEKLSEKKTDSFNHKV